MAELKQHVPAARRDLHVPGPAPHVHVDRLRALSRESYEECRSKALEEVVTAVVAAPIPLEGAPWLRLSKLGMEFLSGLLDR